jgi:hypothetical protein
MRHLACGVLAVAAALGLATVARAAPTGFETPVVVDPIHAAGEPSVGDDALGRVFASGPTGTGTQRSVWWGSVDGGHTFRVITPAVPPTAIQSFEDPPGGGDTDLAFDHTGKQYFSDLYALICLRNATTADGGATVQQSFYPGGCGGKFGADRQWLAVFDPPGGRSGSPYAGPQPLIYEEFNDLVNGAQWVKSTDGLNFTGAEQAGVAGFNTTGAPFGADGYPAIDQQTGDVFQAAGQQQPDGSYDLLLNIGTPNAAGDLAFLDDGAPGDQSRLIHIADHLPASTDVLFTVLSLDRARNLHVAYVLDDPDGSRPTQRQVFASAASAASGWRTWTTPVRVSDGSTATGDAVNVFPWIQAGAAGRADAVWYGSDKAADPSTKAGQAWNVFMAQVVYPTDATGAVTGAAPSVSLVKVSPHPAHYQDICLEGSGCITSQGNRNLADFFQVKMARDGAAQVIYDDTSNGLSQPGFTPGNLELVDHAGAPLVTLARQSSGTGLLGTAVHGPSNAPTSGLSDSAGDALYPVIGGTNVPGLDLLGTSLSLKNGVLRVTTKVVDAKHPATTAARIAGTQYLQYVTRWQMGDTLYYAAVQHTSAGSPTFYAGRTQSVDLCSISACDPHVLTYPEPGLGGSQETGNISCPATPSASSPCTLAITVNAADVGNPGKARSRLEEVGTYAFASSHEQGLTTNPQAEADNVPLEVDGLCCFDFNP